ncbi:MAG: hypothetical protein AAB830_02755 [Patescibacteria group bacterium]
MSKKIVIIGFGLIGKALKAKIDKVPGWNILHIVDKDRTFSASGEALDSFNPESPRLDLLIPEGCDLAFLAIPTYDKGETAYCYIRYAVERGIPVVTCEKGALSYYWTNLEKFMGKIGYSATVGGGTRLLPYLKQRVHGRDDVVVHVVVNGTLNYIFDEMAHAGRSYGEAVEEAQRLGYAEPGATDYLQVLNGEIKDTVMKTAILFNACMKKSKTMRPDDVSLKLLEKDDLARLIKESKNRRYIVSFLPPGNEQENDIIGGFEYECDGWRISAGFQAINSNPLFLNWLPRGVNNSVLTYEGDFGEDGIYALSGPGAGSKPTTASMIRDAKILLGFGKH